MTFATKTLTALRQCAAAALITALAASSATAEFLPSAPPTRIEVGQLGGKLDTGSRFAGMEGSSQQRLGRSVIATTAPLAGDKGTCLHYAKGGVPIYRTNIIKRSCKASVDVKRLTPAWVIGTKTLATMETIYDMGKG